MKCANISLCCSRPVVDDQRQPSKNCNWRSAPELPSRTKNLRFISKVASTLTWRQAHQHFFIWHMSHWENLSWQKRLAIVLPHPSSSLLPSNWNQVTREVGSFNLHYIVFRQRAWWSTTGSNLSFRYQFVLKTPSNLQKRAISGRILRVAPRTCIGQSEAISSVNRCLSPRLHY